MVPGVLVEACRWHGLAGARWRCSPWAVAGSPGPGDGSLCMAVLAGGGGFGAAGMGRAMGLTEYEPGTAFPGVIGRTTEESSPAWPRPLRAKPGAPNVLMI